jgi:hypothetical protein
MNNKLKNKPKTNPIYRGVASGEAGIYPGVASGEAGIYHGVASGEAGIYRGVASGEAGIYRGVASGEAGTNPIFVPQALFIAYNRRQAPAIS